MAAKQLWTVFAVYDDNEQPYTEYIEAKTWQDARSKALRQAEGVILIAAIVPGRVVSVDAMEDNVVPIRGRGHTIVVNAAIIQERELVIPGRCPGCKADTRRAHALTETNLIARTWGAHLSHNGKDLSHERGGKSTDGAMYETVQLQCTKCRHVIWDGVTRV